MRIHEYQAKALLSEFNIPIPKGGVASTPLEAGKIATELGNKVVIKAQVYSGSRGKAGGVKIANNPQQAEKLAMQLIGSRLVTHQTTSEGTPVHRVLVEEAINIKREFYLSIVVDSTSRMPVIMASEAGGIDIEEIASVSPTKIIKVHIDTATGFQDYHGRKLGYGINLDREQIRQAIHIMANLYRLFMEKDCSLVEINPLVVTYNGEFLALDAKINFDDNALYRHSDINQLFDKEQEHPLEVEAKELDISNYIKMNGDIGCMVNGAGLAMAVMDLINQVGGRPANFLDIGTVNDYKRVVNAFKIFIDDPNVKAIMVNIFGGISRGDIIARGIVEAHKQMNIHLPLVIRLAGTNANDGKHILEKSKIDFIEANDLYEAARKATAAAKGETR